jgi:alpha-tubulin suppressor-like RCC1 family protein
MRVLATARLVGVLLLTMGASVGIAGAARADLPPPPPPHGPWKSVSTGFQHTCAINVEDSLFCWGRNGSAQTGTGSISERQGALHRVGAVGAWSQVSTGVYHTCGITKAANLYCWGNNDFGQVGDGTAVSPWLSLYRVGAAGVWSRVSAGNFHTCGITKAANLYCWGDNSDGQAGDGTITSPRFSLYRVGAAGVWSQVSGGGNHTCGITKAANLYCWGRNSSGQAGDGTVTSPRLTLYRVGAAGVWSGISAGGAHTCGITTAKNLYCWGDNSYSQIGDDDPISLGIFYQQPRLTLWRVR